MKIGLALFVFAIVALVVFGSMDGAAPSSPEYVYTSKDGDDWLPALARGEPVRFQLSPATDSSKGVNVHPHGPLDEVGKNQLRATLDKRVTGMLVGLADFRASMDATSARDLAREADMMHSLATVQAELTILENDTYIALPVDQTLPPHFQPEDARVIERNLVESRGETVDVVFVIKPHEYDELREALEYKLQLDDYFLTTLVDDFNRLPITERMDRLTRHEKALEMLRTGRKQFDLTTVEGRFEYSQWSSQVMKDRLPFDTMVDKSTYLMSKRDRSDR